MISGGGEEFSPGVFRWGFLAGSVNPDRNTSFSMPLSESILYGNSRVLNDISDFFCHASRTIGY